MKFPNQYIRAGSAFSTLEHPVPAPYLRRSFLLDKPISQAELLIGTPGYYEVHLNGTDITKGAMAPYRANPDHYIYFDRYDVRPLLCSGKNTIALILGNGIQNGFGAFIWNFHKAPWRGAPQVSFSLTVTYADGTSCVILSDEQTRTAPSPILMDDIHFGEYYDARLEIPNWDIPDFDDSCWGIAESAPTPRGEPRLCPVEPITVQEELSPVDIFPYGNGYIYDFGLNGAGVCRLTVRADAGQKLTMHHFEQLVDGTPIYHHIRYHELHQDNQYTCSGCGTEIHVPRFTYQGFRYVYVEGITKEQATNELLTYLVLTSDLNTSGRFRCSDPMANAIQNATVRSDRTNFHYFPTDCPQREKNGWTGDAALSAEQILLNLDAGKSLTEWLHNIYKAMDDQGNLPGIVPTGTWGYGEGPAWDCVTTSLAYYLYTYYADRTVLEDLAVPLMRQLTFLYRNLNEQDLLCFGLGDWAPPGKEHHEYATPLRVTATVYGLDMARKASFFYDVLQMPEQKAYSDALASRLANGFRTHLIDHDTLRVDGNTQTGQALALQFGLFTEAEFPAAFDHLLQLIHQYDDHLETGVLGARYLFRLLADHGQEELAYRMITRPDHPSYGSWIVRDATTLWESFRPETVYGSSMNHHFWGDVSAWFYYYPGGLRINPTGRDVRHVDIAPLFLQALTFAESSHTLPDGEISVKWERSNTQILLQIHAAETLHGIIRLPKGYAFSDGTVQKPLASGCYSVIQ